MRSMQLLLLGVFGEYIGRIYEQAKNRPLFIIQEIKRAEDGIAAPGPKP